MGTWTAPTLEQPVDRCLRMTSLLLVTKDLSSNATGRAYALWLAASHLGWQVKVAGQASDGIWAPLRETAFAADVVVLPPKWRTALLRAAAGAQVIVGVKPLPASLGRAQVAARETRKPLLVDIDDPDLDILLTRMLKTGPWKYAHPRNWGQVKELGQTVALLRSVSNAAVSVSNPTLQRRYGGVVVPHVRSIRPAGSPHRRVAPVVAFVGTPRQHKGITPLREAVRRLAAEGVRLRVTDAPPEDAAPHEDWLGRTTLEDGLRIVEDSDVVVLPMQPGRVSAAQLPVKLFDAMMAARAIVATDTYPVRWALSGAGLLVARPEPEHLVEALVKLTVPTVRQALGEAARARVLSLATPEAVGPALEEAVDRAVVTSANTCFPIE